jgi:hypothetical protein
MACTQGRTRVVDVGEAGEMAREFVHGLDRKAVPKARGEISK